MSKESEQKHKGKSISDRLGIDEKTDRTALNDLTSNDGSEDPGSELDTVFSNTNKEKNKIDKLSTTQQTSGTPPKGEELDAFTNNASKNKASKKIPKPQADQALNPSLNSANDI